MSTFIGVRRLSYPERFGVLLLAVVFIAFAALVSVPTSVEVQAVIGVVGVIAVLLLRPFAQDNIVARFAILAVASTLAMRYWAWRATETLPPVADLWSFIPAVLLLGVETYAIANFFLSSFIATDPVKRDLPPKVLAPDLPTVDILVPSYNEPVEMLSITLSAAKNINYPADKRKVVLCDDGGTDERCNHPDPDIAKASRRRRRDLMKLCDELDIVYSTRARNEFAKAGNMTAALENLSGDLVVVFDADHVPSRDFLARTVGYFVEEPKLFLVQTPHFFLNPDPLNRNVGLRSDCPPEHEMFYHMTQSGLDRWGGAYFCGSAAVLRRKALDEAGGFSGETVTEDAETALQIHRNGWKSIYVDHAMIGGLQPETFASLVGQRGRWATGMMQLFMLNNPLTGGGLSLTQRMCYLNSILFWLFPLVRMGFILAPLAYLFFGLQIFVTTIEEAAVYMTSYMAVNFLIQNALYGRVRWPLISELYETAQAPYLSTVIFKTIWNPRGARFNVTAKDEVMEQDAVSSLYKPMLLMFALTLAGVVAACIQWVLYPADHSSIAVVGSWALFNFLIVGASFSAIAERRQRRMMPRVPTNIPANLSAGASDGLDFQKVTIVDASITGCRMEMRPSDYTSSLTAKLPQSGDIYELIPKFSDAPHLENAVRIQVTLVKREGDRIVLGARFDPEQAMIVRETVAHIIFGDSEVWQKMRAQQHRDIGLIRGIAYFIGLSLRSIFHTLRVLAEEPGRLRRAKQRDGDTTESQSALMLAFGESFDPTPTEVPDLIRRKASVVEREEREEREDSYVGPSFSPDFQGGTV